MKTPLASNKKIKKDLEKVRKFSVIVEQKLSKFERNDEQRVEKFSYEELEDLNQILSVADYILCKHEDHKDLHCLLKDFVSMINNSVNSLDVLNDEIHELVINAEGSIQRIKAHQGNLSENFTIDSIAKNPRTSNINSAAAI